MFLKLDSNNHRKIPNGQFVDFDVACVFICFGKTSYVPASNVMDLGGKFPVDSKHMHFLWDIIIRCIKPDIAVDLMGIESSMWTAFARHCMPCLILEKNEKKFENGHSYSDLYPTAEIEIIYKSTLDKSLTPSLKNPLPTPQSNIQKHQYSFSNPGSKRLKTSSQNQMNTPFQTPNRYSHSSTISEGKIKSIIASIPAKLPKENYK